MMHTQQTDVRTGTDNLCYTPRFAQAIDEKNATRTPPRHHHHHATTPPEILPHCSDLVRLFKLYTTREVKYPFRNTEAA